MAQQGSNLAGYSKSSSSKAAGESKPEQLSWLSSLLDIRSPWRSMFDHRIQDDKQLVHAGDQRHLFGLPSREELMIEGLDDGVPFGRGERGHIEGCPDHRSATPDGALAVQRAAIAVVGRHPDKGGQLLG